MPVQINDAYYDGNRILSVMIESGVFEKINSNIEGYYGTVVTDRDKIEVVPYLLNNDDNESHLNSKGLWSGIKKWFAYMFIIN